MRYSLISLLGSGLIAIAAGCSSDADDDSVTTNGAKAGHSSKAGAGGKGGAGKAGTAGKASTGATGGSSAGKGGKSSAGKGGKSSAGKGGSGTGNVGAGGTLSSGGTGGADAGASGADTGGSAGSSNAGGEAGMAGAEAAGNGGEAGSGSGSSCPNGVECAAECIDPTVRTLDQIQLDMPGSIGLGDDQRPGESFTVGSAGLLTGIEIAVGPCNGADTAGQIQLELFDEQAASLGHVTLDEASLPDLCGGSALVEETIGVGYFDLTPLCLSVEASTKLTFVLSLVGSTPPTCDMETHECSNNGNFCMGDSQCGGFYYVGFTNCGGTGCDGSGYAGGELVMQNVSSGALEPEPSFELAFKTFVQ